MSEEAKAVRIGSKIGSTILKVKKVKGGISMKAKAQPMELINIAATLIDHVAVDKQVAHKEVIEAVIEVIYAGDSVDWTDLENEYKEEE